MNKLIFRKLTRDILSFFLLSSLAITLIVWVIQGVNLLDIISEQGHGIKVYFFYTALNIPKIFSKLLIFTYFLTLFVVISRYQENNEILVFWVNGIKKIDFINHIAKISIFFVILQLFLNLIFVPYTQNIKQKYLKNSSIDFFPNLIQEKRFSNIMRNLTIFVDENNNGILKGIYIKEKLDKNESKIIIASKGKLVRDENSFGFKLLDGNITNIDTKGSLNLKFKETIYEISDFTSKTRQENKLSEIKSTYLINCLEKFILTRKDTILRCSDENPFLIKAIYEEMFKRVINPAYLIILSLISSLSILRSNLNFAQNFYKLFLFTIGFVIILLSELSYKFISSNIQIEIISIFMPIISILIFYILLSIKSNFNMKYL